MTGFKDFADGNYFTAGEVDGYLMRQTAMRFTTAASLASQLGSGIREVGMLAWADDAAVYYMWDGTNWIPWLSPEKTTSVAFTANSVAITIGNGVVVSKWRYSGGLIKFTWVFTIGSTSNMQTGNLALGIPIATAADQTTTHNLGPASYWDTSASTMYTRSAVTLGTASSVGFVSEGGTRWSTTSPAAFGTGDILSVNLHYRPTTAVYL